MSGGKGGSQSSKVEIPQWIEQPTIRNIARAEQVAKMGYQPYYGPEVAAFTPMQQQAMQSQYDAASAFGMAPMGGDAMAGMPAPTEYAGGVMGYGSGDIFEQSVNEFQKRQPDQAAIYNQQFVGPDVGNQDFYAPGNQFPIMGSGGGKGGSTPTGNTGAPDNTNVNIPELRGTGAGFDGFGGAGGFGQSIPTMPADMPGMPGVPGPFVAQGMGAQIPSPPMVGGGSPDPFDPFTAGTGFNAIPESGMMPFNAPEFNQSQFGQPPAMQAQLPIRAADLGQMQFGRPAGLFGMMGA